MQSSSEQPLVGQEHCVTTQITAAKGTTFEVVFFTNSNFPLCKSKHVKQLSIRSNMSKSRSSASSRLQNTKKRMKAERRRRGGFIVAMCLESVMKQEARVFDMSSLMKQ